jgi:hypothetical protein
VSIPSPPIFHEPVSPTPPIPSPQDNTLAVLASPSASRAVHSAAAALLLRLTAGLQRSVALARDPELAASTYGASSRSAEAPNTEPSKAASPAQQGELLQQLLAAARGADPTCTSSYPPLRLPPAGLADAWRALPGAEQEAVDVSAAVHSVVLQVWPCAHAPAVS